MNIINNFYIKVGLKAWGIYCLVYSFLLTNFIWGNHDWKFLKTGVSLKDGFFEVRYSHHLPSILFFDGNILPVFALLFSLFALSCLSILIAKYLEFPKKEKIYLLFALFIGLNPHNFVIFYYLHYMFQIYFWALIGVFGLYYFSQSYNLKNFILGGITYFLVLGSYPPIFALIFVLFLTKRVTCYLDKKENKICIIKNGVFFATQFLLAFSSYKLTETILSKYNLINHDMYNIIIKDINSIITGLPLEAAYSFGQFFLRFTYMEYSYCFLLCLLIMASLTYLLRYNKIDWFLVLLIIVIFLTSRFVFIIAQYADTGGVRLLYWSKLAIYIFSLNTLFKIKINAWKNFAYLTVLAILILFININYKIQKMHLLSYRAERGYHNRVATTILTNDNFSAKNRYIFFSFTQPNFRSNYLDTDKFEDTMELSEGNIMFEHTLGEFLFWDNAASYELASVAIADKKLLFIKSPNVDNFNYNMLKNHPENVMNMRQWSYTNEKIYPHKDSIYIDDLYVILALDKLDFYKNRELMLSKIDK